MVVVDRLSKYSHFVPLRHPFSAPTVAATFIREVVRLHGVPTSIVSDRDKVFLSSFLKEIFKMQGTFLKRSTAYHPQTDGQSEVVNRSVETYLRCFVGERPKQWVKWLPWAEYWYNTCYHTASQFTPFKILYGRDPPPLVNYQKGTTPVYLVDQYLEERDRVLGELREHLLRTQQIMKTKADAHRKDVTFEVGEMVYLKLRPYRQKTLASRRSEKLSPRYYGPFEIERKVGMVVYRLKLPPHSSIHPVFHASLLKKSIGDHTVAIPTIPQGLTEDMQFLLEPLHVKEVRKNNQGKREILIEWKDLPTHEATWEIYETMQAQFSDFNLEDKVDLLEGGIDGPGEPVPPGPVRVYRRKRGGGGPAGPKGPTHLSGGNLGMGGIFGKGMKGAIRGFLVGDLVLLEVDKLILFSLGFLMQRSRLVLALVSAFPITILADKLHNIRDYIHVMDLADGHIAALQKLFLTDDIGCVAYNLGTGRGTSVLEMVSAFEKASGKKIPLKLCPRRPGDATEVYALTEKAEKELGWRAKYGIEEMCRDQWNWASKNPYGYRTQGTVRQRQQCRLHDSKRRAELQTQLDGSTLAGGLRSKWGSGAVGQAGLRGMQAYSGRASQSGQTSFKVIPEFSIQPKPDQVLQTGRLFEPPGSTQT
ncbi:hypothetical protein KFK09_028169 [Dendrobium nobile]|uniref:UDP-glucose 4-epimerase n=1 Tax=Dendrobium nobile TaxID=94219 RepID=A0A8T3A2U8_DENNO|nr:hypothetical protein KFK09_028169 [Dendrobium nobile]